MSSGDADRVHVMLMTWPPADGSNLDRFLHHHHAVTATFRLNSKPLSFSSG